MSLTDVQRDRAVGAILGSAAGDALGSQYEFGPAHADDFVPEFGTGRFGHAPYGWTDDTEMAIPVLQQLAGELAPDSALTDEAALVEIARVWLAWSRQAKDVGMQTQQVLSRAARIADAHGREHLQLADLREASEQQHRANGRSGGNGSLMRTGPVGLAGLTMSQQQVAGEETEIIEFIAEAAQQVAQLTHWEVDNVDACVLWSCAIHHAILTGELSFDLGLAWIGVREAERKDRWRELIDEAMAPSAHPRDFAEGNGWVVRAFQGALAAIIGAGDYRESVYRAVRGGKDTDTVAAIAGALAGALWGAEQIPQVWLVKLHGWPGYGTEDLRRLALSTIEPVS